VGIWVRRVQTVCPGFAILRKAGDGLRTRRIVPDGLDLLFEWTIVRFAAFRNILVAAARRDFCETAASCSAPERPPAIHSYWTGTIKNTRARRRAPGIGRYDDRFASDALRHGCIEPEISVRSEIDAA